MRISIASSGEVSYIYNDALRFLLSEGPATITRASHVEPTKEGKWTADLSPSGGPLLGPYDLRGEALQAEIEWLENNL